MAAGLPEAVPWGVCVEDLPQVSGASDTDRPGHGADFSAERGSRDRLRFSHASLCKEDTAQPRGGPRGVGPLGAAVACG